jgi:hypothetical protein
MIARRGTRQTEHPSPHNGPYPSTATLGATKQRNASRPTWLRGPMTSTDGDHDFRFCAIMCARLPLLQLGDSSSPPDCPLLGVVLSRRKRSSSTPDKSTPRTCCRAVRRTTSSDFKLRISSEPRSSFLTERQKKPHQEYRITYPEPAKPEFFRY